MAAPPWTVDFQDAKLIAELTASWRLRNEERRVLKARAQSYRCTTADAKRLLVQTALVMVAGRAHGPQRIRRQWLAQPKGARERLIPALVLSESVFGRWVRAQAIAEARADLLDRPLGESDALDRAAELLPPDDLASATPDALDALVATEHPHAPDCDGLAALLNCATPQRRAIATEFLAGAANNPGEINQRLGLSHGQSRIQLRRLGAKIGLSND